jgi:purine-binding chemotaxis protein CheW
MQRSHTGPQKSLVGFVVGDVTYALDIAVVREIISPQELSRLPHLPLEVAGVMDHRGEILPVIDLRVRFGLASVEPTRATKWILIEADSRVVGLVVDRVTEVFGRADVELTSVPELGDRKSVEAIQGVFRNGRGLVFVVDALRLLALADDSIVRSALLA